VTFARWYVPRGRVSLAQFWLRYCLPFMAAGYAAYALDGRIGRTEVAGALGDLASYFGGPVSAVVVLGTLVPTVAAVVCRLHDVGRSARRLWWLAVPVLGWVIVVSDVWFGPGQVGPNRYGPWAELRPVAGPASHEWFA
jgi:uncharacterized membrane protein YhaH (DUF805 family)